MIVGSRLQTLILVVAGVIVGVAGWTAAPAAATVAAAVLLLAAEVVWLRRVELGADGVVLRRARGTVRRERGRFTASVGHRYLTLEPDGAASMRIEVPVEVRPDVAAWVARAGSSDDADR